MRNTYRWLSALLFLPLGCGDSSSKTTVAPNPPESRPAAASTREAGVQSPEDRLYGTWVAKDVDTKMGEVMIKLTFREEGPMKLAAWSDIPFVGQVRDKTAPYEVQGNVISSDAIRGGTSVDYSFSGDDLIIEYKEGKKVRFKRQ